MTSNENKSKFKKSATKFDTKKKFGVKKKPRERLLEEIKELEKLYKQVRHHCVKPRGYFFINNPRWGPENDNLVQNVFESLQPQKFYQKNPTKKNVQPFFFMAVPFQI